MQRHCALYLVNASPAKPHNLIKEQEGREQCVLGLPRNQKIRGPSLTQMNG